MLLAVPECTGGFSGKKSDLNMQFRGTALKLMHYSG
jgi:hypothetical protein